MLTMILRSPLSISNISNSILTNSRKNKNIPHKNKKSSTIKTWRHLDFKPRNTAFMGYRHGSRITTQSHPDYGAATWNGMDMEYGIIIIVLYYIVILSFY